MREKRLSIEILNGTWMLNVVAEANDDGVYEVIHPNKESMLHLAEEHMYGLEYNISAPENTAFTVKLDDEILLEGVVNHTGVSRGNTVI